MGDGLFTIIAWMRLIHLMLFACVFDNFEVWDCQRSNTWSSLLEREFEGEGYVGSLFIPTSPEAWLIIWRTRQFQGLLRASWLDEGPFASGKGEDTLYREGRILLTVDFQMLERRRPAFSIDVSSQLLLSSALLCDARCDIRSISTHLSLLLRIH